MIQLVFDAATPAQALTHPRWRSGYSQHSSAERAEWGDEKLELVDGTHPVVYPAAGSQANFYGSRALSDAEQLRGRGVRRHQRPVAHDPAGREGRARRRARTTWPPTRGSGSTGAGARSRPRSSTGRPARTTRPSGPSRSPGRRRAGGARASRVPGGGALGTRATDVFCGYVAAGGRLLNRMKTNPGPTTLISPRWSCCSSGPLSRTTWRPGRPAPLARARAWGELTTASWRRFRKTPAPVPGDRPAVHPPGRRHHADPVAALPGHRPQPARRRGGAAQRASWTPSPLSLGVVLTIFGYAVVQAATAARWWRWTPAAPSRR